MMAENEVTGEVGGHVVQAQDVTGGVSVGSPPDADVGELAATLAGATASLDGSPFASGTYAIYADTDGSFVLVVDDSRTGVMRKRVPAAMVRMFTATGGGGIMGKLGSLFGGK